MRFQNLLLMGLFSWVTPYPWYVDTLIIASVGIITFILDDCVARYEAIK